MHAKPLIQALLISLLTLTAPVFAGPAETPTHVILETVPVARAWAGHPVGFDLLTASDTQYVAFYDAERRMTVGSRKLGAAEWTFQKLHSKVVWDSHNYVTMALDRDGMLHVSGNMHGAPLIYFRSARPGDVTSLEQVAAMTGQNEARCTYPQFFKGPQGELLFNYRDGDSSKGSQIYNVYDEASRTWKRLLDRPLSDGEGQMNAYFQGPLPGPDGFYHLTWIWRDTGDCSTNHDLCYARSKDLIHWETAAGAPITLPIRAGTPGVIVNPVPVRGGMLNGNGKIGFDSKNRPVLAYHKFDAKGNTQLFNARFEEGSWNIRQASQWDYRWDFSGHGTIPMDVLVDPVTLRDGKLAQTFSHKKEGSGGILLDEGTLDPVGKFSPPQWPPEISKVRSGFPGMAVNRRDGSGDPGYILRWETLPKFRDQPRPEPWPEPTLLEIYKTQKP